MSGEAWTFLGICVTAIAQVVMAYMMYRVKHSVNGMRAKLEQEEYLRGGRDEKAKGEDNRP